MSHMAPADPQLRPDESPDSLRDVLHAVKPKLRGWLHAGATPLAIAAGVVLICLAPTDLGRIGGAIFLAASVMLYGTSGLYHRGSWGDRGEAVLRRMDHANIYVFIAATYTPFALMMLTGSSRVLLLSVIWSAALAGLLFRLFWLSAPRWLYTVLYLAMGWAAVGWFKQFYDAGGLTVFLLILVGGLFYTFGAVVYGLKRPNPSPRWFGFHEIFHACTLLAFAAHYTAISLITYRAG
ncbi:MAG: hemolysin III family protein [Propionibacteriaceae bacterium]